MKSKIYRKTHGNLVNDLRHCHILRKNVTPEFLRDLMDDAANYIEELEEIVRARSN